MVAGRVLGECQTGFLDAAAQPGARNQVGLRKRRAVHTANAAGADLRQGLEVVSKTF